MTWQEINLILLDDVAKTKSRSIYKQICSALLILDLLWYDQLYSDISLLMKRCVLPCSVYLIKRFILSSFLSNSFSDIFPRSNISFTREIFSLQGEILVSDFGFRILSPRYRVVNQGSHDGWGSSESLLSHWILIDMWK